MNVTPDAVVQRLDAGLAPELSDFAPLARELAGEIVEYGVTVLPRELFRGRSGAEVAALIAEDLEAVVWMKPLLAPREVEEPAEPTGDGEEPKPPRVVKVYPRVVEIGSGWSIAALLIAKLYPDQPVELVEPSRPRLWWWRRLTLLHGLKNMKVIHTEPSTFARDNVDVFDQVITKRMAPNDALDLTVPMVREGGRVLSFQRSDRSAEVRRPRENPAGLPVRLVTNHPFQSPAAKNRVLLCVGVGVPTLDAPETAA